MRRENEDHIDGDKIGVIDLVCAHLCTVTRQERRFAPFFASHLFIGRGSVHVLRSSLWATRNHIATLIGRLPRMVDLFLPRKKSNMSLHSWILVVLNIMSSFLAVGRPMADAILESQARSLKRWDDRQQEWDAVNNKLAQKLGRKPGDTLANNIWRYREKIEKVCAGVPLVRLSLSPLRSRESVGT